MLKIIVLKITKASISSGNLEIGKNNWNLEAYRNFFFVMLKALLKIIVLIPKYASISSGNLERPNSSLTLQELKLICIIKHKPPHRGGRWNQITIIFYYATGSHFFLAFFHFRGVSQQHPEMAKAQQATIQTL